MVMIYINFVELHCLMLHTKFQNHWPSGSGEEDFKVFFFLFIAILARSDETSSRSLAFDALNYGI